jgi:hypothetical protein
MSAWKAGATAGVALILASCHSLPAPPGYRVHRSLLDGAHTLPERVVLLPVRVEIFDASRSRDERVEAWGRAAEEALARGLADRSAEREDLTVGPEVDLAGEEPIFEEQQALFEKVVAAAFSYPGQDMVTDADRRAWWPRCASFDGSLGPGLAPVADRERAEAGLVVVGRGVLGPTSTLETVIFVGLVHLRSGDLLWITHARDTRLLVDRAAGAPPQVPARDLLDLAFADYPGLEAYDAYRRDGDER